MPQSTPNQPVSLATLAARSADGFRRIFGGPPVVLAQAPGRINIIGEHVDYQGGLVLPMAINRWCVCAAAMDPARPGLHLAALDLSETWRTPAVESVEPGPRDDPARGIVERGHWASYIAGVVRGVLAARATWRPAGLQIAVASSVPIGAGLSSSAAMEVAVATALESLSGAGLTAMDKARLCQLAEHDFAGVPCGIMDQTVACQAREHQALLIDCSGGTTTRPIPLPQGASFVVINSGVRHALADGDYARPQRLAAEAEERLGMGRLGTIRPHPRSAQVDELAARLGVLAEHLRPIARHHFQENARVLAVGNRMLAGSWTGVGEALCASHRSLDEQLHVSCPELNTIVAAAMEVRGVHGARMTGGGFGGCAIVLVEPGAVEGMVEHVGRRFAAEYGRHIDPMAVRAVGACGVLQPGMT